MNYLQQILAFDDYRLYEQKLSAGQIALWHALMSINNKAHWQKWFTAANKTLESLTGLSRSGINSARNSLKQYGLINFETMGPHKATKYFIKQLYTSDSVHSSEQSGVHSTDRTEYIPKTILRQNSGTLIKQNKTETKQNSRQSHAGVWGNWQQLWGFPNAVAQQDLQEWSQEFTPDLLNHVIEYAGRRNVQARAADNYIDRVLQSYRQHQPPITTVAQAKKEELSHYNRTSKDFDRSQKYRYEAKPEPIRTPQKGDEPF